MNILLIEDEKELQASAVAQLELKGHTVYPTNDIAESRAILSDSGIRIDLIICDHRLPDGLGIQFIIEIRKQFPDCNCVIVSGCLTNADIETLESNKIPYYKKPLLYAKLIEEFRKAATRSAPIHSEPQPVPVELPEPQPVQKKKKLFGFWPLR